MNELIVRCRLCGALIHLNGDGEEARRAGTDPRQQLRRHIAQFHPLEIIGFAQRMGWLLDMLLFECPWESARWRKNLDVMIEWAQSPEALEFPRP
jgi:hypothetical protein